jgi:hypothetical protein
VPTVVLNIASHALATLLAQLRNTGSSIGQ